MDSISKSYAKEIAALKLKKYRQKHQKFIVEGPNLVLEAQRQDKYPIECIVGTKSFFDSEKIIGTAFPRFTATLKDMKRISALKNSYDCLAVLKMGTIPGYRSDLAAIYLDSIQDPGNLGTILRSAEWFGMSQIMISSDTVDPFNNKVIQASAGSIYRVSIIPNAESILGMQNNKTVYGLDMEGQSIYDTEMEENAIFIIGNEGRGIKDQLHAQIKYFLNIPGSQSNRADSLNAAVSTSILLSEWYKKSR